MLRLIQERLVSNADATIGMMRVERDGKRLLSVFTLEDEYRTKKVYGETRIPAGIYQIGLRETGGFHSRYADRFDFHQGMLHIKDVPGFEYILIHIGNTDEDTAGCLLIGEGARLDAMTIQASTSAYTRLYPPVAEALDGGEDVSVSIIDRDL